MKFKRTSPNTRGENCNVHSVKKSNSEWNSKSKANCQSQSILNNSSSVKKLIDLFITKGKWKKAEKIEIQQKKHVINLRKDPIAPFLK